ncbi:hypothetical protein Tco_0790829 [Tanacetum coccineum]
MVQRIKCWLVQAQASGQALTEEEIHFWQIQDFLTFKLFRQSSHPYAAYQADDLDAYDSDYNLNYDLFNQSEQIMTSSEQSNDVSQTETDITSDSNIIPYSQYLSETQQNCPDLNSSAQQDFLILSLFYDGLNPKFVNGSSSKQAIGFEKNLLFSEESRESKPKLYYAGNTFLKMDTIVILDSDETLELVKRSRSKMLLKDQDPCVCRTKSLGVQKLSKLKMNQVLSDKKDIRLLAQAIEKLFELSELRAQSQAKDTVIVKLKEKIKSLKGNVDEKTHKEEERRIRSSRRRREKIEERETKEEEKRREIEREAYEGREEEEGRRRKKKEEEEVVQIVLWYLDSGCSKHMTGDRSQLTNFISKFLGTVKFGNDQVAKDNAVLETIRLGLLLFQGFITLKDLGIIYFLWDNSVIPILKWLFVNTHALFAI